MTIDLNTEAEKTRVKIDHLRDRLRSSMEWAERRWLIAQLREQNYLLRWQMELLKRTGENEEPQNDQRG